MYEILIPEIDNAWDEVRKHLKETKSITGI